MPISHLKEILDESKFPVTCIDINGDFELKEYPPDTSATPGELKKVVDFKNDHNEKIKIIKFLCDNHQGFLNKHKNGYTQICDYLIFVPNGEVIDLVFCELKQTLNDINNIDNIKRPIKQLKSTIPLVEYILSAIKIHHKKEKKIKQHYVILIHGTTSKRSVSRRDRVQIMNADTAQEMENDITYMKKENIRFFYTDSISTSELISQFISP